MKWLLAAFGLSIPLICPTRTMMGAGSIAELLLAVLLGLAAWKWLTTPTRQSVSVPYVLAMLSLMLGLLSLGWNGDVPFSKVAPTWNQSLRHIQYIITFFTLRALLTTSEARGGFAFGLWGG